MNVLYHYLPSRFRKSLRGQTMAEYAFVVVAIAVALIASYALMGQHLSFLVNKLGTDVGSAS